MNRRLPLLLGLTITAAAVASYPPYVKKHLYASVDLRGQRAPKLAVEEWVKGGKPSRAGKTVLVDLWATWCPSCRDLIPELNRWSEKFKNKLVVVGISDESASTVKEFMSSHPMNYHVAVDSQQRLEKALMVEGIPHVLVISPDGIVRWQGYPEDKADPLTDAKLKQILLAG